MVKPTTPRQQWRGGRSLAGRILAVNILPLVLLAGSVFYLDGFRARLLKERLDQTGDEARLIAAAIGPAAGPELAGLARPPADDDRVRFRLVTNDHRVVFDSWPADQHAFLADPSRERSLDRRVARVLDRLFDLAAFAAVPPPFPGFAKSAELAHAKPTLFFAPDRTHIISVRRMLPGNRSLALVMDRNARDVRRLVRSERGSLGIAMGIAALISVLLSRYLARTIVRPLRMLAVAANDVRYGQAREVTVPRLPSREDEIGLLARAVSDMTLALRSRIDAIEAFAADVAHELKNPLASLRSAVETLHRIKDEEQRGQLLTLIGDDVRRMDRLIGDISDLSRLDAQIGRIRFGPLDLGELTEATLAQRSRREAGKDVIAFARPIKGTVMVHGDAHQLERVLNNLLDNAASFAPPGSVVRVGVTSNGPHAVVYVDDEGPGIPEHLREAVFERFHSNRPPDQFGAHSGLGLAIARAILEAHGGSIRVEGGSTGKGTRVVVHLALLPEANDDG